MDAVILVGGFGTRLRPLTLNTPKQMLPVGNKTMIEAVVDRLAVQGITRVILGLGYRPDVFMDAFPDNLIGGLPVEYVVDPEPLDTAGAVRYAVQQCNVERTFLALNGDVITTLDVAPQVQLHRDRGALGTLHLVPVDDPSRYGVVPTDEHDKVLGFVEKPDRATAPSRWINAGTYVLEPEVIDLIPDGRVSIERETFPLLAATGRLFGYQHDCYWVDAGTHQTYLDINLDLLDGKWGTAVQMVSTDAIVATGAKVTDSLVCDGSVVSSGASVVRSLISPAAKVGPDAVIEDSIIGSGAMVGRGARVVAGSVVGPNATVEPGQVLDGTTLAAEEP
jgi:mannose-1-phosphate guanylyltransferase